MALLMAAGSSRRAGGCNKLLARDAAGQMMIARSLTAVLCSQADAVIVVLGHQRTAIAAALHTAEQGSGLLSAPRVHWVNATRHAEGLSASLHAGLSCALSLRADAVMVCLGDMPLVRPRTMDRLIERLRADPEALACVPVIAGRRGNPVLWRSDLFASLMALGGDRGGRDLLERHASRVLQVAVDDSGIVRDFDTPDRLAAFAVEPTAPADELANPHAAKSTT